MKKHWLFFAFIALFVAGWIYVWKTSPTYLVAYSFAGFSVAWAVYRLPARQEHETLSSFFLYERVMPRREFIGTLVTTNIGFFSSVAFSCVLIVSMGIGPAILAVIAWILGLVWFARYVPQLIPFFRKGSTLHEYIATSYGVTAEQKRHLRFYSSTITFTLYVASVGAEIKFTSDVFSQPTQLSTISLAMLLGIAGIIYVSIAGYRGVVRTDRMRFWAILVGVAALYYFLCHTALTERLVYPSAFLSPRMLTIGPTPLALVALLILLGVYQFCVMDMWERCIAIVNSADFKTADTTVDSQITNVIRRMIWQSTIPFLVLFGAWYGIGLLSLGQHWTDDPNRIVMELVSRLGAFASTGLGGAITETLIIMCFTAAALSTIDGFIIAAVQTVVCDWFPSFTTTHQEWSELDTASAGRWLMWARVLVIVVGAVSVGIAYLSFGLLSFWVGMYSLMLAFFPAVFLHITRPEFRRPPAQIAASIVLGALGALICAILGTFVIPTQDYLAVIPPVVAVAVATLILIPPAIRTWNLVMLCLVGGLGAVIWFA